MKGTFVVGMGVSARSGRVCAVTTGAGFPAGTPGAASGAVAVRGWAGGGSLVARGSARPAFRPGCVALAPIGWLVQLGSMLDAPGVSARGGRPLP
jgi:hypothetical protein